MHITNNGIKNIKDKSNATSPITSMVVQARPGLLSSPRRKKIELDQRLHCSSYTPVTLEVLRCSYLPTTKQLKIEYS